MSLVRCLPCGNGRRRTIRPRLAGRSSPRGVKMSVAVSLFHETVHTMSQLRRLNFLVFRHHVLSTPGRRIRQVPGLSICRLAAGRAQPSEVQASLELHELCRPCCSIRLGGFFVVVDLFFGECLLRLGARALPNFQSLVRRRQLRGSVHLATVIANFPILEARDQFMTFAICKSMGGTTGLAH